MNGLNTEIFFLSLFLKQYDPRTICIVSPCMRYGNLKSRKHAWRFYANTVLHIRDLSIWNLGVLWGDRKYPANSPPNGNGRMTVFTNERSMEELRQGTDQFIVVWGNLTSRENTGGEDRQVHRTESPRRILQSSRGSIARKQEDRMGLWERFPSMPDT